MQTATSPFVVRDDKIYYVIASLDRNGLACPEPHSSDCYPLSFEREKECKRNEKGDIPVDVENPTRWEKFVTETNLPH